MDPLALILLVGIAGVVASVVAMRRTAGGGVGGPRLADARSVLIGGGLVLAAAAVAFLLLWDAMG